MRGRVLFVSKPIAPPYQDGTKCLVRDLALNLETVTPIVMSSRGTPSFAERHPGSKHVVTWSVYATSGSFRPGLGQNMRAVWSLLSGADADLWHFVFAPNPKSSRMGAWLKRLRGVPVVQTVASPPRDFSGADALLFGDVVVAQSHWTKQHLLASFGGPGSRAPRIEVIPPPVPELSMPSAEQRLAARRALDIPEDAPLFVYPGDLETSSGADAVAKLVAPIVSQLPNAVVVFTYRQKTSEAPRVAERLKSRLDSASVRIVGDVADVLHLLSSATAVLFPVDDLWGKVDLPIVLLEAMSLSVPVIVLDEGPLTELEGVVKVPSLITESLLQASLELRLRLLYIV
jgi:phosphatidylinositol alpha-1,6-mannosyltransferase